MAFHPSASHGLILAAGDKKGNVALWQPDSQSETDEPNLLSFPIHSQYVSAIQWLGSGASHTLASSSYDGSIRLLDANTGTFEKVGCHSPCSVQRPAIMVRPPS